MYPEDGPRSTVDVLSHDSRGTVADQSRHRPVRRPTPPAQRIGYARTKADQDDLHQAVLELQRLGVESALVYTDRGSRCRGKDRGELQSAIAAARPGDSLVVASLARLARSHHDLAAIIDTLQQASVTLEVAGHSLDQISSTAMVKLSAQLQADLITDAVAVAEHNHYTIRRDPRGAQPTLPPMTWLHLRELFDSGMPREQLAALFKISKPNMFRIANKPGNDEPAPAPDSAGTTPDDATPVPGGDSSTILGAAAAAAGPGRGHLCGTRLSGRLGSATGRKVIQCSSGQLYRLPRRGKPIRTPSAPLQRPFGSGTRSPLCWWLPPA